MGIRLAAEFIGTLWLVLARFPARDLIPYVIVQVLGAVAGAGILYLIASGRARDEYLR